MEHVTFKDLSGQTFRVSKTPGNMNDTIEQRFMVGEGNTKEIWIVVNGPNQQLRNLAIDALSDAVNNPEFHANIFVVPAFEFRGERYVPQVVMSDGALQWSGPQMTCKEESLKVAEAKAKSYNEA